SQGPAVASSPEAKAPAAPPRPYVLPQVTEILSKHAKKHNAALEMEIADKAHILQKTLEDFHVKAKIINACHGPAVTRYELEPAPGVKVSKITNLADDLALSLAATSVRIEPIPGKAAIGIEVPNKELEGVQLREVLENEKFLKAKSKLTVGLGMDIGGQAIFADLAKMPHLLVAGATGSGKSVCINTLITSILFKAKPEEVKFILVDPKMVELSNYNGIPHLMVPVVTEAKKAASVLNWSVQEMEKRYAKFAEHNVRNMETYNTKFPEDKMPAIVIIIDELADLMMVAPHDVEDAICRLAQKARAAGIHMVLATQRPSVDVITGIIKANIPSRISFAVSSQIDSRTILDRSGAEKLLGRGDMLFYPVGAAKPMRVQGAFISDEEVEHLLDFIRSQGQEMEANEEIITFTENAMKEDEEKEEGKGRRASKYDELLPDAVNLVMSTGQASASSIQRRFRVGYTRAARLIDEMEDLSIVGPNIGSKPREILMNSEQAAAALAACSDE
ncbi:DNA translocase FtsK, partial [Mitsuokella multacida]